MPELPEVETTRRGLAPHLMNQRVRTAIVRNGAMRQPIPKKLPQLVAGTTIESVERRAKYLLIGCGSGTLIVHLGMSGRLWLVDANAPVDIHDHFDLVLENGSAVRLRDPRRFGLVLWETGDPLRHPLLASIGPEPLSEAFDGAHLKAAFAGRKQNPKTLLLDQRIVAGLGNIYVCEALFEAGISPLKPAGRVGKPKLAALAQAVRGVLTAAIEAGGSTLRDYAGADGALGYFQHRFRVYDREGEPCLRPGCGGVIRRVVQGGRSTFFCPVCQR